MINFAAFIGGWELPLIAAVPGILVGVPPCSGLKGRHSIAQGKAPGATRENESSPERAAQPAACFAHSGLGSVPRRNPGLCPGLSNDAPLGLGLRLAALLTLAHVPLSHFGFTTHLNPQESL